MPLQLTLPVLAVEHLVAFRAAHIFMPGHVLHLPQVVLLQPKGDDTVADLVRINDFGIEPLQLHDHVPHAVTDISGAGIDRHRPG